MKRIDTRLDKIEKLLEDNMGHKVGYSQQMFNEEFMSLFPMDNINNINDVDTKIKNFQISNIKWYIFL